MVDLFFVDECMKCFKREVLTAKADDDSFIWYAVLGTSL